MSRAPILVAALAASGLGLTGLAVSASGSPMSGPGPGEIGTGAVVTPAPRPEAGRWPPPAPLARPARAMAPPDRASVPRPGSDGAQHAPGRVPPSREELLARFDALASENGELRAALEAARARHARERERDLSHAIRAWIETALTPAATRVRLGDGRELDLRHDLARVLGDVAAWARAEDLDQLRRHVDATRLADAADVLAWWYAESAATGRQDWDERERRLEAVLGCPAWNPPPPGATFVAAGRPGP